MSQSRQPLAQIDVDYLYHQGFSPYMRAQIVLVYNHGDTVAEIHYATEPP